MPVPEKTSATLFGSSAEENSQGGRIALGDRLLGLGTADAAHLVARFRPTLEAIAAATGETVDWIYTDGWLSSVLEGRDPYA